MKEPHQSPELLPTLKLGLGALNLKLPSKTLQQIVEYINLLHKWNKAYNLTAIRDPNLILIRHIFDSLAITPFIVGPNILDFGTGAGFPGLPLALALPSNKFVLLDSSNKKTTFLKHIALTLGVKNIDIRTQKIEVFNFLPGFDTIVTRATTTLKSIFDKTRHLVIKNGQILVMKGKYPQEELKEIKEPVEVYCIKVPYLEEERHLVKIFCNQD